MTLLDNTDNTDDALQNYCTLIEGIFGKLATLVHNARAGSYTKNFIRFRDVVWCTSVQNNENPKHITHKIYADIRSKTFQNDKEKLDFLQNTVNALSVKETMELKQIVRKMALPRKCRAYIIGELNARRRQCIHE